MIFYLCLYRKRQNKKYMKVNTLLLFLVQMFSDSKYPKIPSRIPDLSTVNMKTALMNKKNQQNTIFKHYLVVKVISKITFRRNKITIKTKFNNFFVVCTFLYLISIKNTITTLLTNLLNRFKCL